MNNWIGKFLWRLIYVFHLRYLRGSGGFHFHYAGICLWRVLRMRPVAGVMKTQKIQRTACLVIFRPGVAINRVSEVT